MAADLSRSHRLQDAISCDTSNSSSSELMAAGESAGHYISESTAREGIKQDEEDRRIVADEIKRYKEGDFYKLGDKRLEKLDLVNHWDVSTRVALLQRVTAVLMITLYSSGPEEHLSAHGADGNGCLGGASISRSMRTRLFIE